MPLVRAVVSGMSMFVDRYESGLMGSIGRLKACLPDNTTKQSQRFSGRISQLYQEAGWESHDIAIIVVLKMSFTIYLQRITPDSMDKSSLRLVVGNNP